MMATRAVVNTANTNTKVRMSAVVEASGADDDYSNSVNSEYAALVAKAKGMGMDVKQMNNDIAVASLDMNRNSMNNRGMSRPSSYNVPATPAATELLQNNNNSNKEHATAFKSQVVDLLRKIAPENVSRADDMIGQFEGREYALLETRLQMMQDCRLAEGSPVATAATSNSHSHISRGGFESFSDEDDSCSMGGGVLQKNTNNSTSSIWTSFMNTMMMLLLEKMCTQLEGFGCAARIGCAAVL